MRVRVDRNLCIAASSCVQIAPEVFQLDDENTATVINPQGADDDTLYEAAESCPTSAIILEDENGKQLYP